MKDDYDGATPTASSVGAMRFLVLAEITGRKDFRDVAGKTLASAAATIRRSPYASAWMMCVAEMDLGRHARLVIAGKQGAGDLLNARFRKYAPGLVTMGNQGKVDAFTGGLKPINGKAAAYYCEGRTCQPPVTDPQRLVEMLQTEKPKK